MTEKELLYLEDAIGHEQSIISLINFSLDFVTDKKVLRFFQNELDVHKDLCKKLIKHMEVISNE